MKKAARPEAPGKCGKIGVAPVTIAVFLAIYILLPEVLLYPYYAYYRHIRNSPSPVVFEVVHCIFYPIGWLQEHVPGYVELTDWESHVLGINK